MKQKFFIIQLGSYSTKYGLSSDDSPTHILSKYYKHTAPQITDHNTTIHHSTDRKSKLCNLIITKLGFQVQEEEIDEQQEPVTSSQSQNVSEIVLDDPLPTKSNTNTLNQPTQYLFGQEAIYEAYRNNKKASDIFNACSLPLVTNGTCNKQLLEHFFLFLIDSKVPREEISNLGCLITIPNTFTNLELLILSKILLENIGIKSVLFQYEFVAALYSLKLSSVCFVDIGGNSTKICCLRDGFEIYQTRVYLPYGSNIQDKCIESVLQSESDISKISPLVSEQIKKNNTFGSYTNTSESSNYSIANTDIKITLPKLRTTLTSCFINTEVLNLTLPQSHLDRIKKIIKTWMESSLKITSLPPTTDRNLVVQKLKDTINKKFSKSAQKRKRYTPEQQYNEGRRFQQSYSSLITLDNAIVKSLLSTEDVREAKFYAQQIVLLGGGSKTKRIVFGLEKSIQRIIKSTLEEADIQILKVKPETDADILPWYGMKEYLEIEDKSNYFLNRGSVINESCIRNIGLIDFENMAKFHVCVEQTK